MLECYDQIYTLECFLWTQYKEWIRGFTMKPVGGSFSN